MLRKKTAPTADQIFFEKTAYPIIDQKNDMNVPVSKGDEEAAPTDEDDEEEDEESEKK